MITFVRMNTHVKYSIVVPVYNRPQEIDELLQSLTRQTYSNFELLIIEDRSTDTCVEVYEKYTSRLKIRYFFKPNSGPGPSRNFGFENATGEYFVVFDSDCILPPEYFQEIERFMKEEGHVDAWGGPDRGHAHFTNLQKAMAFTMSSPLTTGGIRGNEKKASSFQPRSFNMGISRKVFKKTGGFKFDRYAEDIELSIRIKNEGFKIGYIHNAFVYHKRRTNLKQFFWQVYNFGRGRVMVGRVHSGAIKVTHWFPSFYLMGLCLGFVLLFVKLWVGIAILLFYLLYLLLVSLSAQKQMHSIGVTLLAGPAAFIQLTGYGVGFLSEMFKNQQRQRK